MTISVVGLNISTMCNLQIAVNVTVWKVQNSR